MKYDKDTFYDCGQRFVRLRKSTIGAFKRHHIFAHCDRMYAIAERLIAFSETHPGFFCAVTEMHIGKSLNYWAPILFMQKPDRIVRVGLENTRCPKCGWCGILATPAPPDLYENIPNKFEVMRQACNVQSVPCPHCGAKLSRIAVWVGEQNPS